jgi:integrase
MKKNGRADETVETAISRLKHLNKLCNITEPEQVKAVLATSDWMNSTKHNVALIYTGYIKYLGKKWTPPKYTKETPLPFIPTEMEIDSLISASKQKTATLLQFLKETASRIGEATQLEWTQLDLERKIVYIKAEKGSNSRNLPISTKLIAMLNNIPKINNKVFQYNRHALTNTLWELRRRTAKKLNNPRLNKIHFHTFRHWKATMEYHATKDIIHVQHMLGHRSIENTMIYINLDQALFLEQNNEWTVKVSHNIQESTQLLESGFEYVTDQEGLKLYRKRK